MGGLGLITGRVAWANLFARGPDRWQAKAGGGCPILRKAKRGGRIAQVGSRFPFRYGVACNPLPFGSKIGIPAILEPRMDSRHSENTVSSQPLDQRHAKSQNQESAGTRKGRTTAYMMMILNACQGERIS